MSAAWSPQQREWLQALGHEVLVLAAADTAPGPAADAHANGNAATTAIGVPGTAGSARPPGTAAGDSPLLRALLRAAGRRDPGDLAWLPDPATLRGNAAAKRALWPRLRTLRQGPRKP